MLHSEQYNTQPETGNQSLYAANPHTHARTHARTHAHTHTQTRARARTHTHTHTAMDIVAGLPANLSVGTDLVLLYLS